MLFIEFFAIVCNKNWQNFAKSTIVQGRKNKFWIKAASFIGKGTVPESAVILLIRTLPLNIGSGFQMKYCVSFQLKGLQTLIGQSSRSEKKIACLCQQHLTFICYICKPGLGRGCNRFSLESLIWPLTVLQPVELEESIVSNLKALDNIKCQEYCSIFKVYNLGSKQSYFNSSYVVRIY